MQREHLAAPAGAAAADLNARQLEAVSHLGAPLLVLAGPGSGKTRVLVHRIAFLLQAGHARPEEILAVTFTRKAAGELRARLAALGPEGARVTAGTFHALGARWLRADGERIGIPPWASVFDEADAHKLLGQALADGGLAPEDVDPARAQERVARAKSRLLTVDRFAAWAAGPEATELDRRLVAVYARYQDLLNEQVGLDFDDLILRSVLLFHYHPALLAAYQARFRYVLVDEFQDTSFTEYQLLHLLIRAHPAGFTAACDDDQAIYGWPDADIRNLARAADGGVDVSGPVPGWVLDLAARHLGRAA